jgi:hypothetical protein
MPIARCARRISRVVVDVGRLPDIASRINNISPTVFTVRGELLDERPDLVKRYLEQAIRTARWARDNQAEAKRLIARDSSLAEELVDLAYSPHVAAVLEPSLDPRLIGLLENQKDFTSKDLPRSRHTTLNPALASSIDMIEPTTPLPTTTTSTDFNFLADMSGVPAALDNDVFRKAFRVDRHLAGLDVEHADGFGVVRFTAGNQLAVLAGG